MELERGLLRFKLFLPTPSARRATSVDARYGSEWQYFYPRPPRGGRLLLFQREDDAHNISIHALREEGDEGLTVAKAESLISIHALREEGDYDIYNKLGVSLEFLSTPSARRATWRSR